MTKNTIQIIRRNIMGTVYGTLKAPHDSVISLIDECKILEKHGLELSYYALDQETSVLVSKETDFFDKSCREAGYGKDKIEDLKKYPDIDKSFVKIYKYKKPVKREHRFKIPQILFNNISVIDVDNWSEIFYDLEECSPVRNIVRIKPIKTKPISPEILSTVERGARGNSVGNVGLKKIQALTEELSYKYLSQKLF